EKPVGSTRQRNRRRAPGVHIRAGFAADQRRSQHQQRRQNHQLLHDTLLCPEGNAEFGWTCYSQATASKLRAAGKSCQLPKSPESGDGDRMNKGERRHLLSRAGVMAKSPLALDVLVLGEHPSAYLAAAMLL